MRNCSYNKKFLIILFIFSGLGLSLSAQKKVPFIFRKQEEKVAKRMHRYLRYDSLIEVSKSTIHITYSKDLNKPYLLLLHGMGVDGKTNWYRQIPYLSKHYNLLIPDLIYFGSSTAKENNYSVEFQAEQIHEVLRALKIPLKINVMGFSYGGLAAAMYNELYHSEVNKLVIIDGPVKFFSLETADSLAQLAGVASMTNVIIPQNLKDYAAMEKAVLSKKYPITRNLKYKIMDHYFIPGLKIKQQQLYYLTSNQGIYQKYNYNLDTTPTLLIWGAKDGVVPVSVGEKLHKHFPNTTQLIVFKKAKHDTHFRCYKQLNRAVVNFLDN